MIEFKQITKYYPQHHSHLPALNNINLRIKQGDIFGLIGYSGAGKSTLIRLINALEAPSSGHVLINGQSLFHSSPQALRQAKKKIGMVFQHFNLLESKTVAENIALPLKLSQKHLSAQQIDVRVTELLDFVGIPDKKSVYPRALSGGQKQRVGIARALVNRPDILLCDEATSALDPQTTLSILNLLKKINQEQGITIVMVTHQMQVIEYLCHQVAVMEHGQIVESGTTAEIFQNPKAPITRRFISTVLEDELPLRVLQQLEPSSQAPIYRLEFLGDAARQPIMSQFIKESPLTMNILFANMIEINGLVIGGLFVRFEGEPADLQAGLSLLEAQGVRATLCTRPSTH